MEEVRTLSLKQSINELRRVIDKQIELHERLKDLLNQKRVLIQSRQIDKLDTLVSQEEKIIFDINGIEKEREEIIGKIANYMNINKKVRAIELCERLPQPHSIDLMLKFVKLMEIINDIAIINMGIKNMLEFENTYMELTMRLLGGNLKKEVFYTNSGKHKEDPSSSFLDGRA